MGRRVLHGYDRGNASSDIEARAAHLREQSGFRPSLAGYCRAMSATPPFGWPVYKMFDQIGRYTICYMLIHNHYAWLHEGGPVPTLTTLQAVSGASERQTAGLIAALKSGRLVHADVSADDRRVRHLRPSPAMIAEIGRSMRLFIAAVDEAAPAPAASRALMLMNDIDMLGDVIRRSAAYVLEHGNLLYPFPRILNFARRDCGYLLLTAIFAAYYSTGTDGAPNEWQLSCRHLAQRFQVSAAHVGNLMSEAGREGLFSTGNQGRLIAMDSGFAAEFEQWASWQMVFYSNLADAALEYRSQKQALLCRTPDILMESEHAAWKEKPLL